MGGVPIRFFFGFILSFDANPAREHFGRLIVEPVLGEVLMFERTGLCCGGFSFASGGLGRDVIDDLTEQRESAKARGVTGEGVGVDEGSGFSAGCHPLGDASSLVVE